MLRLSRSLSRLETQDIMTQPLFNQKIDKFIKSCPFLTKVPFLLIRFSLLGPHQKLDFMNFTNFTNFWNLRISGVPVFMHRQFPIVKINPGEISGELWFCLNLSHQEFYPDTNRLSPLLFFVTFRILSTVSPSIFINICIHIFMGAKATVIFEIDPGKIPIVPIIISFHFIYLLLLAVSQGLIFI